MKTANYELNAIQFFNYFFKLYSGDVLITIVRRCVSRDGNLGNNFVQCCIIWISNLNYIFQDFLINSSSPYRHFAQAIPQAIIKLHY